MTLNRDVCLTMLRNVPSPAPLTYTQMDVIKRKARMYDICSSAVENITRISRWHNYYAGALLIPDMLPNPSYDLGA